VGKATLGRALICVLRFSPVIVFLPVLRTHLHIFIYVLILPEEQTVEDWNFPKSKALLEIEKNWLKKCFNFHLVFEWLNV
jgi:hypothetical protein